MDIYTYLFINAATISVPLIASFYPRHPFYKKWKYFLKASLPIALVYILWDAAFTRMGVWGFNDSYLIGYSLLGLPIEELLFFVCIPFACTFTFFALGYFFTINANGARIRLWASILVLVFLALGVMNYQRWYTSTAMVSCAVFFALVAYYKWKKLPLFILTYVFCLIPFYLVNGVLTGSFIAEQVVWYNDFENLGSRIFTVPVDDLFYSLSLQGFNILFFDKFLPKRNY